MFKYQKISLFLFQVAPKIIFVALRFQSLVNPGTMLCCPPHHPSTAGWSASRCGGSVSPEIPGTSVCQEFIIEIC